MIEYTRMYMSNTFTKLMDGLNEGWLHEIIYELIKRLIDRVLTDG